MPLRTHHDFEYRMMVDRKNTEIERLRRMIKVRDDKVYKLTSELNKLKLKLKPINTFVKKWKIG